MLLLRLKEITKYTLTKLNDHFINVGSNLAEQISNTNIDPTSYIHNSPTDTFTMTPVSQEQIIIIFSDLNETKSSTGIPNKLIKIAAAQISVPFTRIYNESINTGIVPAVLKISKVTPLYKYDSPSNPINYRPISILSSFSKVLEKIIHDQLQTFLEEHNILFEYQFGFRKNHSTEQAILDITEKLKSNIDKKIHNMRSFP